MLSCDLRGSNGKSVIGEKAESHSDCKFVCCFLCTVEKTEDPFIPEPEPVGFFPPPQRKRPPFPFVADAAHRLPPADGFIPNSVLIRLLFPEKTLAEQEESKCRTPGLTSSQMENMNQFNGEVQCYLRC